MARRQDTRKQAASRPGGAPRVPLTVHVPVAQREALAAAARSVGVSVSAYAGVLLAAAANGYDPRLEVGEFAGALPPPCSSS